MREREREEDRLTETRQQKEEEWKKQDRDGARGQRRDMVWPSFYLVYFSFGSRWRKRHNLDFNLVYFSFGQVR